MANTGVESSQQQSTIRQWIKNLLGLVFVALLFLVLIKVLALSRDVEDSRKLLKELSNKLVKTQKENEDLRKQLGNTNAKVEIILRKFSSVQKVSQVRRKVAVENDKTKPKHKLCHRVKACLQNFTREHQPNCASLRSCMPEHKQDFLQLDGINVNDMNRSWSKQEECQTCRNILWQNMLSNDENNVISPDKDDIHINRTGTYRVYCNMRAGTKYIKKVSIITLPRHHKRKFLFSSSLTYDSNNSIYEVRFSRLVEFHKGTKLFVQVKFTDQVSVPIPRSILMNLFPDYKVYIDNFGVFSLN